jgi:uncharacterized membrane-anchored protein YhcB (DUF1043 family)
MGDIKQCGTTRGSAGSNTTLQTNPGRETRHVDPSHHEERAQLERHANVGLTASHSDKVNLDRRYVNAHFAKFSNNLRCSPQRHQRANRINVTRHLAKNRQPERDNPGGHAAVMSPRKQSGRGESHTAPEKPQHTTPTTPAATPPLQAPEIKADEANHTQPQKNPSQLEPNPKQPRPGCSPTKGKQPGRGNTPASCRPPYSARLAAKS